MKNQELGLQISNDIKFLASQAVNNISLSQSARHIARERVIRPIDYMRYAEFDAILKDLELTSPMAVLDVSSPQWFSLYLANKYPHIEFHYINIIDRELDPYKEIAKVLNVSNLHYKKEDVRDLKYAENSFDRVISISVIEHISPAEGGDLKALSEIGRVLKPEGELLLTVPYKSKSNIVYIDGEVYERENKKRNFHSREYDQELFNVLIEKSALSLIGTWFICEKKGFFPIDYYEWGPGKNIFLAKKIIKSRKLLERIFRKSLDETLANHYLNVSQDINGRLVNISARLKKSSSR